MRSLLLSLCLLVNGPAVAGPLPAMAEILRPTEFPVQIGPGQPGIVVIHYLRNADPDCLIIRLNGEDFRDSLSIEPDSIEHVTLPLLPGRNVLEFEVLPENDGDKTDKSRIDTFIINRSVMPDAAIEISSGS